MARYRGDIGRHRGDLGAVLRLISVRVGVGVGVRVRVRVEVRVRVGVGVRGRVRYSAWMAASERQTANAPTVQPIVELTAVTPVRL